jgi:uncharacterized protein (TIGR01777 family)
MEILLTGGTGLLGRALCEALRNQGHRLCVLSRHPHWVSALCGEDVHALRSLDEWLPAMHFDAVINLAGAPLVDRPWSAARKQVLWASRVGLTEQLVTAINRAEHKPAVLLSGSAIGYYGDCGEASCSDASDATSAQDFGARLCAAWEASARRAEAAGLRVCLLRTGLVLARDGGLLARMRLPFSLGLGGRMGDGRQWMSWIQREDWLAAVLHLLQDDAARGAYNLVSPQPLRNSDFTTALAAALHRPAILPMPDFALRLIFGERAYLLLGGQRVLPDRLLANQFSFRHADIAEALEVSL